jgi:hypothetical protein
VALFGPLFLITTTFLFASMAAALFLTNKNLSRSAWFLKVAGFIWFSSANDNWLKLEVFKALAILAFTYFCTASTLSDPALVLPPLSFLTSIGAPGPWSFGLIASPPPLGVGVVVVFFFLWLNKRRLLKVKE